MFNNRKKQEEARQREAEARATDVQRAAQSAAEEQARAAKIAVEQALLDKFGYEGGAKKVFDFAAHEDSYEDDLSVILQGATRAFHDGYPENLRAFIGGYLKYKSKEGALRDLEKSDIDAALIEMVVAPAFTVIQDSHEPRSAVISLATGLSPYFAQTFLDLSLRAAVIHNNAYVADVLLDLGADVNAHDGHPLWQAYNNDFLHVAAVLLRYKPDTRLTMTRQLDGNDDAEFKAFLKQAESYPLPRKFSDTKLFAEMGKEMTQKKPPAAAVPETEKAVARKASPPAV